MKIFFILFTLFGYFLNIINSSNVLALLGMPSPSHHIWNSALLNGLALKGHNITAVSADIDTNPLPNVHYIHLDKVYEDMFSADKGAFTNMLDLANQSPTTELHLYGSYCLQTCESIFKSTGTQRILNYPDTFQFDVIIYDYTCGPCLLFLLQKFNFPPLIGISAFSNPPFTIDLVGGHRHHAYIPFYSLAYGENMNFWQRSYNVFIHLFSHFHRKYEFIWKQDKIVRKHIDMDFPYLEDIERKTILALVNSHPAIDFSEPFPPSVIPVGGLQIKDPKTLPKNLDDFVNQSEKGAILFSLGTNVKSEMLGSDIQTRFLKAFEQFPQYHFLWKFETDIDKLPMKVPKNVLIEKWLPQNDILGHPNVKAFITHAGGLSTLETTWHGVPQIGIPFFVDQHRNMEQSLRAGVAEKLTFPTFTIDDIVEKIRLVLETPSYREKMQLRSQRFKDQKEKPLDRAIWWIEWVLRNPQPNHIESPVKHLGFIRANCLDIYSGAVVILFMTLIVLCKIVKICLRKRLNKRKLD